MIAVPDHWHALRGHRGRQPEEGYLRRKAARPHHRRAAGHRQGRREEQHHLADRLLAALAAQFPQGGGDCPQRPHRQRHRTSKSACPAAITTFPAPCPRCLHKLASLPGQDHQPCPDCARHARMGSGRHRAARRPRLRHAGLARRRWSLTSSSASTRTGAGTTTPAAASCWTGSATMATSRTGAWASISTGPSESRRPRRVPAANAVWNTATKYTIECKYRKEVTRLSRRRRHDHRRRLSRHRDGNQMDRHRRLGLGRPRRLRCLESGLGQAATRCRKICARSSSTSPPSTGATSSTASSRASPPSRPVETAHHSTIPGHLGLISMLVGRKIHWDVAQEKILNDPAASELLSRPYRAPYKLS